MCEAKEAVVWENSSLNPCSSCGSSALVVKGILPCNKGKFRIVCPQCSHTTDWTATYEEAINAWQSSNPVHGSVAKIVIIEQDGDSYCAHFDDFINLQESPAGFGNTPEEAKEKLHAWSEFMSTKKED